MTAGCIRFPRGRGAPVALAAGVFLLAVASPAYAYVGPGAGFVLSGPFLAVFLTMLAAFLSLVAWPCRMAWRSIRNWRRPRP